MRRAKGVELKESSFSLFERGGTDDLNPRVSLHEKNAKKGSG